MNYEEFKEALRKQFLDGMPEQYQDMDVEIASVEKTNTTYDGLVLKGKTDGVSPILRVNDLFKTYQEGESFEDILADACKALSEYYVPALPNMNECLKNASEKVVFTLVNTKQNEVLLQQVPHRQYMDLSIMYRIVINSHEDGIFTARVTNDLAARLGMSEEQLFDCAVVNTKRIFPPVIREMREILIDMLHDNGIPRELAEMTFDETEGPNMWVISNSKGMNGAASMLYEDELHGLAKRLGSNFYILPSSIHEIIAVADSDFKAPEELAQMVAETNVQSVSLEERLSNSVYYYDRDLRKVSLVESGSDKRLDEEIEK